MTEKLSSGCVLANSLLNGGYEKDVLTTIFGPAGSGKTTMCLLCCKEVAKQKKVIFIDTEGGFSPERFEQLGGKEVLDKIFLLKPTSFSDQVKAVKSLNTMINDAIGLIVIDTISMQYRVEVGKAANKSFAINQLGEQIALMAEIARKKKIPVLITNQVYSDFDARDRVKMVGGDLLKYSSKCHIELTRNDDKRKMIVRKHRSIGEVGKEFVIVQEGFKEVPQN